MIGHLQRGRVPDSLVREVLLQIVAGYFGFKAIPPTYAPPRPPPTGKPLTNRQKIVLAATILLVILVFVVIQLLFRYRII